MPIRHFISVDLPAPFSPIKACTVPLRVRSWTSLRARTPGNCLEIPSILSRYSSSIDWLLPDIPRPPSPSKRQTVARQRLILRFQELLVVFLSNSLVGNPDPVIFYFSVGLFF